MGKGKGGFCLEEVSIQWGKCSLGAPNPIQQELCTPGVQGRQRKEGTVHAFQGLTVWRERPVSSILATACPTLDRGKSWGEIDPPALSCTPARPQSILLQPFLSELPLPTPPKPPGLQLWPGPAALLGGWFAIRAAPIGPPFLPHQEPWELGRHSSAGSDMNLLLRAPGDQS